MVLRLTHLVIIALHHSRHLCPAVQAAQSSLRKRRRSIIWYIGVDMYHHRRKGKGHLYIDISMPMALVFPVRSSASHRSYVVRRARAARRASQVKRRGETKAQQAALHSKLGTEQQPQPVA